MGGGGWGGWAQAEAATQTAARIKKTAANFKVRFIKPLLQQC